eukprot:TRINITY_DN103377_c0_g1_i1.p1 TRINITY_DN103377_c0_g1~~TRINITY_DN103377_c0_g1_i1.p1  ORF type:complete len:703 (-),score=110.68 TRINITY_DN103377_c0_g1_i1:239-2347(-)
MLVWIFVVAQLVPVLAQYSDCVFKNEISAATQVIYDVQCATFQVPLDYSNRAGQKIPFHVTRIRPRTLTGTIKAQVWLLNGGPGIPGNALLEDFTPIVPFDFEFILPDHRGSGYSSELACPDTTQNILYSAGCQTWARTNAAFLQHFTVTNAARDIKEALDQLKVAGRPVIMHGTSYGTLWLQRFLQLYPNDATAASLDSPIDPLTYSNADTDQTTHDAAVALFQACDQDATCKAPFIAQGTTATAALTKIISDWNAGTQPCIKANFPLLNTPLHARQMGRVLHAWFDGAQFYYNRVLFPATFARLARCASTDVTELTKLFSSLFPTTLNLTATPVFAALNTTTRISRHSLLLQTNILLSDELYNLPNVPDLTRAQLNAKDATRITTGTGALWAGLREAGFPRYPADVYSRKQVTAPIPVFVLGGELDPATPVAQTLALARQTNTPEWFVHVVPNGAHVQADLASIGNDCPFELFLAFWDKPSVDPTTTESCWRTQLQTATLDWTGQQQQTRAAVSDAFGSTTLIPVALPMTGGGNPTAPSTPPSPPAAPSAETSETQTDDEDTDESTTASTEDDASMSGSGIAGLVIGCVAGGLILIALLAMMMMSKKKQRNRELRSYNRGGVYPPTGGPVYGAQPPMGSVYNNSAYPPPAPMGDASYADPGYASYGAGYNQYSQYGAPPVAAEFSEYDSYAAAPYGSGYY